MLIRSVKVGGTRFFLSIGAMNVAKNCITERSLGNELSARVRDRGLVLSPSKPISVAIVQQILQERKIRRMKTPEDSLVRNDQIILRMSLEQNQRDGRWEFVARVADKIFRLHHTNRLAPPASDMLFRYAVVNIGVHKGQQVVYVKGIGLPKVEDSVEKVAS